MMYRKWIIDSEGHNTGISRLVNENTIWRGATNREVQFMLHMPEWVTLVREGKISSLVEGFGYYAENDIGGYAISDAIVIPTDIEDGYFDDHWNSICWYPTGSEQS